MSLDDRVPSQTCFTASSKPDERPREEYVDGCSDVPNLFERIVTAAADIRTERTLAKGMDPAVEDLFERVGLKL